MWRSHISENSKQKLILIDQMKLLNFNLVSQQMFIRIAATSSTVLDIVYAKFDCRTIMSENGISDHHGVFVQLNSESTSDSNENIKVNFRKRFLLKDENKWFNLGLDKLIQENVTKFQFLNAEQLDSLNELLIENLSFFLPIQTKFVFC